MTTVLNVQLIQGVSEKNVPFQEVLTSGKGTFFLRHPVELKDHLEVCLPYIL